MTSIPLAASALQVGYDGHRVLHGLDLAIAEGQFTVIVGPNACGKSTLLAALARMLRPEAGQVVLDGTDIHRLPTVQVARRLALLPQTQTAPSGITVTDLVSRGRFAHQRFLRRWSDADTDAVRWAMQQTGIVGIADAVVDELSGGQRQRVWLATVLAQDTQLLLLDEPTTYLDIAHQIDVLDHCRRLHQAGRTLVAVLHDLNHAARYATQLVVMKAGQVVAVGPPDQIMTADLVGDVFGLPVTVIDDPVTGRPLVIPLDTGAPR
ncbi:MAG: ABC transporter ATP-binding protein [Micropruina sp.]|uniref:ABC transporter ATP-binding protein n=1 Tax=Micropruina sp. TaxID=2737536 RepID=UPI0039E4CCD0